MPQFRGGELTAAERAVLDERDVDRRWRGVPVGGAVLESARRAVGDVEVVHAGIRAVVQVVAVADHQREAVPAWPVLYRVVLRGTTRRCVRIAPGAAEGI